MNRAEADRRRFLREEYISRINRVIDYVDANLDEPLNLDRLAGVAGFSPFHFHRIFRALAGESLNRFIQRLRAEKAARLLLAERRKTITEIALDCGFSSSAVFARAFKQAFGMSATQWRNTGGTLARRMEEGNSKIRQMKSKTGEEQADRFGYLGGEVQLKNITPARRDQMNKQKGIQVRAKVENLPDMEVAYVRHIGSYQGDQELFSRLIGQLMARAGPRGLLGNPQSKLMCLYHDDPDVTEPDKQRMSICLTVPPQTKAEGEIGRMTLSGGQCAVAEFELSSEEFRAAWDAVYGDWLPESGFQPDDRPPFEVYKNDPLTHPEGKSLVDICVPVKPV